MACTRYCWKIENFSSLRDGKLPSPTFSSHSTTWEVRIYKSPDYSDYYILFGLYQVNQMDIILNFSLAFLDLEGSPLFWREYKNRYFQFLPRCLDFDLKVEFGSVKEKLLRNDILTLECRIWKTDKELVHVNSWFACTRIESQSELIEKTLTLKTAGVLSLMPEQRQEHEHTVSSHGDKVKILLFFDNSEQLQTEITLSLMNISANCKISLLDTMGKHILIADNKFYFGVGSRKWPLSTGITKTMLKCNVDKFFTNGTLILVFAFTFSCKGTFCRTVEENGLSFFSPQLPLHDPNLTTAVLESNKHNENFNDLKISNRPDPQVTMNQVLWSMYEEGYMTDFSLHVEDSTFPVHKAILGARSSVFRAMFAADMKEKESGSVDIPDVDADTIQKMLKFIYCDSVQEDMQWESASSLYAAADKYALEPLKQRCSVILKSKLCAASVPGVMLLAATYTDQDLESAVVEFISRNDKLIIDSEPWCKFEKDNPQIAFDVLRKLYVKKMNG